MQNDKILATTRPATGIECIPSHIKVFREEEVDNIAKEYSTLPSASGSLFTLVNIQRRAQTRQSEIVKRELKNTQKHTKILLLDYLNGHLSR